MDIIGSLQEFILDCLGDDAVEAVDGLEQDLQDFLLVADDVLLCLN